MSDETFRVYSDSARPGEVPATGPAPGRRVPPRAVDDTSDDLLSAFNAIRRTLDAVREEHTLPADPTHTGEIPKIVVDADDYGQGPGGLPKRSIDPRPDAPRAAPAAPVFLYAPPSDEPPADFLPGKRSWLRPGRPPFAKPPFASMSGPAPTAEAGAARGESPTRSAFEARDAWTPASAATDAASGSRTGARTGIASYFESAPATAAAPATPVTPAAASAPEAATDAPPTRFGRNSRARGRSGSGGRNSASRTDTSTETGTGTGTGTGTEASAGGFDAWNAVQTPNARARNAQAQASSAQAPSSQAPSSQAPSSQAPSSQALRPQAPGSRAPASAAPGSQGSHGSHGSHAAPAREGAPDRRKLIVILSIVVIVALIAAAVAVIATQHKSATAPAAAPAITAAQRADDTSAAAWVVANVGPAHIVACDTTVCGLLSARGFPATSLVTVQSGVNEVEQADTVVVTAPLRRAVGSQLAAITSPEPVASFGSGTDQVQVTAVALNGPTAYAEALEIDRQVASAAGNALLANHNLTVSDDARTQLAAGLVDARLCVLLSTLLAAHHLAISTFTPAGPGAGVDIPSAGVEFSSVDGATPATGSTQVDALLAIVDAQQSPYLALSSGVVADDTGAPALSINFSQPGMLELLGTAPPTHSTAPVPKSTPKKKTATKKK